MLDSCELNVWLGNAEMSGQIVGSEEWWELVKQFGTPFITLTGDLTCDVLFLWRDPQGNEHCSETASVLLDVNSLTDHHSWEPTCLERIAGSNVWIGQLTIDSRWRGSYSFIPIKRHQLPNVVQKTQSDSSESQRRWWLDVAKNQTADKLNVSPELVSGWGMSSPLHLPGAVKEVGWSEWEQGLLSSISVDRIQIIRWSDAVLGNQRDCWLFSTAAGEAPLVVLLDGQKWSASSGTLSVLQHLTDTKKIAPAHYLLIPSIDGKTRWKELGCHFPFWQSLISNLLPIVQIQLSHSQRSISDYVVAGQSLGGLSALYAGLVFPEYFSKVISLSGSFWWPEESRMRDAKLSESQSVVPNGLADQILQNQVSVTHLNVFMTVGVGEEDMHLYNEVTCEAIKRKGGAVYFDRVYGGHDWLSWRSGLVNGLRYLMPVMS